ncbi:SpoIID/LytB domain-containing protein, partial [Nocardia sp. CA2R105]|uniref:SpoIID/LytB domain-containing protein n=1 Tax=Nocardia coffeae TaxID=2873381 RepID=UPI001CA656D9
MTSSKRPRIVSMRHGGLWRKRRHRRVAMAGGMVVALTAGTGVLYWAWPDAVPYRPTSGADEGHGRGMSQFGALDQAKAGKNAVGILQGYYPGAQLATIAPTMVRVRLMGQDNKPLDVYSDSGLNVAGRHVLPGQVAHLTPTSGSAEVTILSGCGGDVLWQGSTADPWVHPIASGLNRPAAEQLKICGAGGYRGELGVALEGQDIRTVDRVDTEDYLRGVVPTEMSADWADQGGGQALRAQAIAARSYALAETRYPYAQTCDTQDCQAYSGTSREDPRTDAAVHETAGQVLLRDGHLLRSEYSSAPNGVHPMDAGMFEIGPTPAELTPAPAAPMAPAEPPAEPQPAPGPSVIDTKYAQTGGPTGSLGAPLGPESLLPGHGGTFRLFRNGVIIATKALGAQVIDFTTLLQLAPGAATTPGAPTPNSTADQSAQPPQAAQTPQTPPPPHPPPPRPPPPPP